VLAPFWALLVAMAPIVRLSGPNVACPSADQVDAKLTALLPGVAGPAMPDTATLEEGDGRLRVVVTRPDGSILGRRDFPRAHACPDLASAVALAIATWESNVHPEFVLGLPQDVETPSGVVPAASTPLPAAPVSAAVRAEGDHRTLGSPPPGRRGSFDLGVGLLLQAGPDGASDSFTGALSVGATVLADWLPEGRRLGARLGGAAGTARALAIGAGEARWQRVTIAAGPLLRWVMRGPLTAVDLHAELLGAALDVQGSGFVTNADAWTFDAGGGAGARLWLGTGRWRPWLDAGVQAWSRRHLVYARPSGDEASLPRVEGLLTFGLAFVTAPAADGAGR